MRSPNQSVNDPFDLETVLRATRTISSELDLGRLADSIVSGMVENVGAQTGYLVLERGNRLCIEAGMAIDPAIDVAPRGHAVNGSYVAESIVRYAYRTREVVLLEDATQEALFADDPYVLEQQPRSVICMPIRRADRTLGVAYLENNLAPRVFSPERVRILTILAAQAAISLENALLYRELSEEVAERARAQDALKRLNEDLEKRVEERTQALRESQAELLEKERLAALGQLTATVSHELRNPFGTLVTSCHTVRRRIGDGDPALLQTIDRMERTVDRCLDIVEQLVFYSAGRSPVREAVKLDDWLARVLERFQFPEGVQIRRELCLDGRALQIDRERLEHAVVNVIKNACQAMSPPNGATSHATGQITVESREEERIEFVIGDTGTGISPEVLPHVFDPLYSTKSFGVGLGLSTARKVMEEHGGGIEIVSADDGSTVTLWLPLDDSDVVHANR